MDLTMKYESSNIVVAVKKLEGYMNNSKNEPTEVRKKVTALVEKEIELIKSNIKKGVAQTLKNAEIEFLQSIKNLDELTETEFDILVKRYSDNYFCCKALKQIADKNSISFNIITLDEKISLVDELKDTVQNIIDKYKQGDGAVDTTEVKELLHTIHENGFVAAL